MSGASACPYEGQQLTKYFQPGLVLSEATQRQEIPVISASPNAVFQVPEEEAAVFTITMGNDSDTEATQEYGYTILQEYEHIQKLLLLPVKQNLLLATKHYIFSYYQYRRYDFENKTLC